MNTKNIAIVAVIVVLVGVGSFYAGMQYSFNQKRGFANMPGDFQGQRMGNRQNGNGQNGGFVSGEVISKDDKSLTVKLRDGGSKIIFISEKTTVGKMSTGSISDVAQGANITVMGAANADGSITAQTVQLRDGALVPGRGPQDQGMQQNAPQPQ